MNIQKNGQVALIVLLVAAVVLTLGLSVSKKAVTEIKIDSDEELLKQAFDAAESAIDYYLATGSVGFTAADGMSMAMVVPEGFGGGGNTVDYGSLVLVNNPAEFWMVAHDEVSGQILYSDPTNYTGSSVNICTESSFVGALKVDYFYRDGGGNYQVSRAGYNFGGNYVQGFQNVAGNCINNFSTPGATKLLMVVTPLVGPSHLVVSTSTGTFPDQGLEIDSTGYAGDLTGNLAVNTQVKQLNRYKVPLFMLDPITSGGDVLSN